MPTFLLYPGLGLAILADTNIGGGDKGLWVWTLPWDKSCAMSRATIVQIPRETMLLSIKSLNLGKSSWVTTSTHRSHPRSILHLSIKLNPGRISLSDRQVHGEPTHRSYSLLISTKLEEERFLWFEYSVGIEFLLKKWQQVICLWGRFITLPKPKERWTTVKM